jgi:hypothetical protein
MAQRTIVDKNGVRVIEAPPELVESGAAPEGGQTALERLRAMRGADGARKSAISVHQIEGESWHLKTLDWKGTTLVGILLGREGVRYNKTGSLECAGAQTGRALSVIEAFTAVLLHVGVVCGTEKPLCDTPYFSLDVAREYATETEAKSLVAELFSRLTDLNPETLPLFQGMLRAPTPSQPPTA